MKLQKELIDELISIIISIDRYSEYYGYYSQPNEYFKLRDEEWDKLDKFIDKHLRE